MAESILQARCQMVRYGDYTVKIQTRMLQGIECLCLQDVQHQFPSVTTLRIDDVQQLFLSDEQGELLKPLRIAACVDKVIDAIEPTGQSNNAFYERFDRIDESMKQLQRTSDLTLVNTQEMLRQIKYVMTQMYELQEYTTPRYFFILPSGTVDTESIDDAQTYFYRSFKLYFLCECSDEPDEMHLPPQLGYTIKNSKAFVEKYGPYLQTTMEIVKCLIKAGHFALPYAKIIGNVIRTVAPSEVRPVIEFCEKMLDVAVKIGGQLKTASRTLDKAGGKQMLEYTKSVADGSTTLNRTLSLNNKSDSVDSLINSKQKSLRVALQGPQLRELQSFLANSDKKRNLGNLYRTFTPDGHVRWVCHEHYGNLCHNSETENFLGELNAMGGTYNDKEEELLVAGANLTSKHVKALCNALKKGLNILKLLLQDCSVNDDDFDTLVDTISNNSSITDLELVKITVRNRLGMKKYQFEYALIKFSNETLKIRFGDNYHESNTHILGRFLCQKKECAILDFSASDFIGHERDFGQYIDVNGKVKRLIIQNANNIDILQAISNLKKNTLSELELRNSLRVPATLSQYCKVLEESKTLVEVDLMDETGFEDEAFIVQLLAVLKSHSSIKDLSLHVTNVRPSTPKEISLKDSLRNTQLISHLCISESVISSEFTTALIRASKERDCLVHLELYSCEITDDDISKLESLYKDGNLKELVLSKFTRRYQTYEVKDEEIQPALLKLSPNATWQSEAVTVAGGNTKGNELNQLNSPFGLYIEDDKTLLISDRENHRIVEWKCGATSGQVIAGGNGQGNQNNQLNRPTDVVVDKKTNTILICDKGNRRVMRWPRQHGITGDIIIENISCRSLRLYDDTFLYVSDNEKHEVKRYKIGEKHGTVVAGGNGKGSRSDQLSGPSYFAIDMDESVYVSDYENHRVTKWIKGAKERIVVAGGQGSGNSLTQVSYPNGLFVDFAGTVYVTELQNLRATRWPKGAIQGTIIAGGNGLGKAANTLTGPESITFDLDGNLYVADSMNHRVQQFTLKSTS